MNLKEIDKLIDEAVEEIWKDTIHVHCPKCDSDNPEMAEFNEAEAATIIRDVLEKVITDTKVFTDYVKQLAAKKVMVNDNS